MSGAPEPTHDQKADPQHGEPREILVKHPAPWKRSVEWEASIPVLFWNVEWHSNRRVGTGEEGYVFVGGVARNYPASTVGVPLAPFHERRQEQLHPIE
jgi:hypothetical protein